MQATPALKWHRTTDESIAAGYGRNAYYTATHAHITYTAQPTGDATGWFLDAERTDDGANLGGWAFNTLRDCKAHALKHAQVHGNDEVRTSGYPAPVACTACGHETIGTYPGGLCRVCHATTHTHGIGAHCAVCGDTTPGIVNK